MIFQVVSMFPDIKWEKGVKTTGKRIVLIWERDDSKRAVRTHSHAAPEPNCPRAAAFMSAKNCSAES